MKKLMIIMIVAIIGFSAHSQDIPKSTTGNNEIGINLSNLLIRFFNLKTADTTKYYEPDFMLNYKRYFKHFAIRVGAGFDIYNHKDKVSSIFYLGNNNYLDTTINLKSYSTSYKFALGIEQNYSLGKKWKLFYGLDLIYFNTSGKNQTFNNYSSNGELIYSINKSSMFGPSLFAGIRFDITDKFSIYTESTYWFYYKKATSNNSYLLFSTPSNYTPDQNSSISGVYSYFTNPISIHCSMRF